MVSPREGYIGKCCERPQKLRLNSVDTGQKMRLLNHRTNEKEVVPYSEAVQRVADGGIAACGDGGMDFGGESEGVASLSRSAYDGTW